MHVYFLIQKPMEESIFDIQLSDRPMKRDDNREKCVYGDLLNDKTKGFIVVDSFLLRIALCDWYGLEAIHQSILFLFHLINLLAAIIFLSERGGTRSRVWFQAVHGIHHSQHQPSMIFLYCRQGLRFMYNSRDKEGRQMLVDGEMTWWQGPLLCPCHHMMSPLWRINYCLSYS